MIYRLYLYSYEDGWEKLFCKSQEEINKIISELSPYDYDRYIIIRQLKDRDEIFDTGSIAKPNIKILKPKNKN